MENKLEQLFKHLSEEHNLILTDSEMNDIRFILLGEEEYLKEANKNMNDGK